MKNSHFKRSLCLILSVVLLCSALVFTSSAAASGSFTIESPYKDVKWDGDDAWGAYKGTLHSHSTVSDAEMDLNETVFEHYRRGFDFLALTDHGVTGKAWNEEPTHLPLYLYQYIIGNKTTKLTDAEYRDILSGAYPVDGKARGYGMTCVTNGNKLNALTVTKCHVNGMFLPDHAGDNHLGYEDDHEGAVRLADKVGGLSFINHPGDWLNSGGDIAIVSDPKNVHYFSDILLKYKSCIGMEVFNERNHVTPYDRILWDNVLMECLPYGKYVIGFSNNDAHYTSHIDSSYSVFMMPENTQEQIKKTMQSGAFFCVTRELGSNSLIGPEKEFDVRDKPIPYPEFHELTVNGHQVTVRANNCNKLQWIANGKVIAAKAIEQSAEDTTYVLDLDDPAIKGVEDFLYIRCELIGEGGMMISQPLVLERGTEKLTYTPDTSVRAKVQHIWQRFLSLRIFAIIRAIIYKLS